MFLASVEKKIITGTRLREKSTLYYIAHSLLSAGLYASCYIDMSTEDTFGKFIHAIIYCFYLTYYLEFELFVSLEYIIQNHFREQTGECAISFILRFDVDLTS